MATYTTNYNLKKPALADKIRIADFNGNSDTIDGAMHDNAVLGAQLKSDIGIVENTNTATHNISAGQYVIWKGDLYTASDAISSGATLSNANLTAVTGGGLNALNSNLTPTPVTLSAGSGLASGLSDCSAIKIGKIIIVTGICVSTGHTAWTDYDLLELPAGMKFAKICYAIAQSNNGENAVVQGFYDTNKITLRPLGASLTTNDFRFTLVGVLQ